MAHYVVYGSEILCAFSEISRPLKQAIITIIKCEYASLDVSKLISLNSEVIADIESFAKRLMTLARKLSDCFIQPNNASEEIKHFLCHDDIGSRDNARGTSEEKEEFTTEFAGRCSLLDIEASLTRERTRNDMLESEIEQLRITQENCLTRMEKRVKQAETVISEKLRKGKLERRKEAKQCIVKKCNSSVAMSLEKNRQSEEKATSKKFTLPKCSDQDKDSNKYFMATTRTGRRQTPKSDRQLQEEIKWSQITPIPIYGARKRYQRSLTVTQKGREEN